VQAWQKSHLISNPFLRNTKSTLWKTFIVRSAYIKNIKSHSWFLQSINLYASIKCVIKVGRSYLASRLWVLWIHEMISKRQPCYKSWHLALTNRQLYTDEKFNCLIFHNDAKSEIALRYIVAAAYLWTWNTLVILMADLFWFLWFYSDSNRKRFI